MQNACDYVIIRLMGRLNSSSGLLSYQIIEVATATEQSVIVEWLKLDYKLDIFHL